MEVRNTDIRNVVKSIEDKAKERKTLIDTHSRSIEISYVNPELVHLHYFSMTDEFHMLFKAESFELTRLEYSDIDGNEIKMDNEEIELKYVEIAESLIDEFIISYKKNHFESWTDALEASGIKK